MSAGRPRRAIFLDRDGVLNRPIVRSGKPYPPATLEEFEILPDAADAVALFRKLGFSLFVVTNQPDVARGTQERSVVEAMHNKLRQALALDQFYVCYHDDRDACQCRKPRPGLLLEAAAEHNISLPDSYMIGDRWRDIDCGQAADCKTIFIDYGYSETLRAQPQFRVPDFRSAADVVLFTGGKFMSVTDPIAALKVKLFADGADKAGMLEMYRQPHIQGFTTNPTLMRKAGIKDYEAFARDIVEAIPDRPISLEVFADEFDQMERQARIIAKWGSNVYVKIPVSNTKRESAAPLVKRLAAEGIRLNVTALLTLTQVRVICDALRGGAPSCVSVFAGRIADTGVDPVPVMAAAVEMLRDVPGAELIWASPRELLNVMQADSVGCHIITATSDILKKLALVGKDHTEYSLDTVKMFHSDATASGFTL